LRFIKSFFFFFWSTKLTRPNLTTSHWHPLSHAHCQRAISRSFTCTPLDLNPGRTYSEGFLGSQNGLYQWTITPGLCWNHFTILITLAHKLKQNHEKWWKKKSKKLWDFCWDPNKVLIFTASLSFNVTIMSTAKYSAHLCVGTYILGWWWWFSTTILWCEVEKKTKKSKEYVVHMMTSCIRGGGYIHLLRDSLRQTSSFPLPISLKQKLNTDLILCRRLDHMIIFLCLASSS
jgi:hypothetical protein